MARVLTYSAKGAACGLGCVIAADLRGGTGLDMRKIIEALAAAWREAVAAFAPAPKLAPIPVPLPVDRRRRRTNM